MATDERRVPGQEAAKTSRTSRISRWPRDDYVAARHTTQTPDLEIGCSNGAPERWLSRGKCRATAAGALPETAAEAREGDRGVEGYVSRASCRGPQSRSRLDPPKRCSSICAIHGPSESACGRCSGRCASVREHEDVLPGDLVCCSKSLGASELRPLDATHLRWSAIGLRRAFEEAGFVVDSVARSAARPGVRSSIASAWKSRHLWHRQIDRRANVRSHAVRTYCRHDDLTLDLLRRRGGRACRAGRSHPRCRVGSAPHSSRDQRSAPAASRVSEFGRYATVMAILGICRNHRRRDDRRRQPGDLGRADADAAPDLNATCRPAVIGPASACAAVGFNRRAVTKERYAGRHRGVSVVLISAQSMLTVPIG